MKTKSLVVTLQKKSANRNYVADFVMSAATPDRVGDTIDPAAYKRVVRNQKSIPANWQHDHDKIFGAWEQLRAVDDTLVGSLRVANTDIGKMVKQLIEDDIPVSASIGFRGTGAPNESGGIHFKDIEILETSIVSVPCHPRAIQIIKSFNVDPASIVSNDVPFADSGGGRDNPVTQKAKAALLRAKKITGR